MDLQRHYTVDPDGRAVRFDEGSHRHLAEGNRAWLLDHIDSVLATISLPDFRELDPRPGRERFYARHLLDSEHWMRVVVDFNDKPGWVVTALIQDDDPRPRVR